jgi:hypothetical protein
LPRQIAAISPTEHTGTLAMSWHHNSDFLPFDTRPQTAQPAGWYRFVAPPGLRAMTLTARGKVQAWADGKECRVSRGEGREPLRVELPTPAEGCVVVALRIEQERGCYGGAALPEFIQLDCGPGKFAAGDWSKNDGLASYSGGAWYRKSVTHTAEQLKGAVTLDLGAVAASAEVRINGQPAGIKVAPPWTLDVTKLLKPGENKIEILVCNTLANHYLTVPTRYRGSPVSGLLGPVVLKFSTLR